MRIYKLVANDLWASAKEEGVFRGAGVDLEDGYIHFSTASQAPETAKLHFAGRTDLVILEIEADHLGPSLQWEPSRGGQLFPHLYAELDCGHVLSCRPIDLDGDGVPDLGELAE
jgi:uncharacterized protein (DUF952 family)